MKRWLLVTLLSGLGFEAQAGVVYSQPHDGGGGFYQSSWWDPDGSDYDQLTWDRFRLTNATAITEIRWRGAFDPSHFGMNIQTTPANSVAISWTTNPPSYVLQTKSDLVASTWSDATNSVRVVGATKEAIIPAQADAAFFRLIYP